MKKLSFRGFTLVELMIVIAIIGILAAVLYPSMTGYFERSRDTNRQGALRNVSLSLVAYQTDKSMYPTPNANKCMGALSGSLLGKYIQQLPKDPKASFGVDSCTATADTGYGYVLVKDGFGSDSGAYVLAARMEVNANANFTGSNWSGLSSATSQIGSGVLVNVNQKGNYVADTATGWFYTVGQ